MDDDGLKPSLVILEVLELSGIRQTADAAVEGDGRLERGDQGREGIDIKFVRVFRDRREGTMGVRLAEEDEAGTETLSKDVFV